MARLLALCSALLPLSMAAFAQAPAGHNLVVNGGFENGTTGWTLVLGGYGGQAAAGWQGGRTHARIVDTPVHSGKAALLLDSTGLTGEVDAYSEGMAVTPGDGYRLRAYVRELAGDGPYKVTIDWQDAKHKHLSYDNDWRGNNKPAVYTPHGGVFVAPAGAAYAVLILGDQSSAKCVFDDVSFTDLGKAEPLDARPRHDGDGTVVITGPSRVAALGTATWHVTYTCGASGLPVGGAVELRRWPLSFDWSVPQGTDPAGAGYVRALSPAGADWEVSGDNLQDITLRLGWPALKPGQKAEFIIGDTSGGGPGMRVQGKPEKVRWLAASDCDADGKYAPVTHTSGGSFTVVPATPAQAVVEAQATAEVGRPTAVTVEVLDAAGNVVSAAQAREAGLGEGLRLAAAPGAAGLPEAVRFAADGQAKATFDVTFSAPGPRELMVDGAGRLPAPAASVFVSRRTDEVAEGTGGYPRAYVTGGGAGGGMAVIENRALRLVFPRNPVGVGAQGREAYGYAAVYVRAGGRWAKVGALPSLGRVVWAGLPKERAATPLYAAKVSASQRAGHAELVFTGYLDTTKASRWPLRATFSLGADPNQKDVAATYGVQARSAEPLLAFYGPELYAGDGSFGATKREALFPGLEYLTADEASSSDDGVAWQIRQRWVPNPYKITVPLMAVSAALPAPEGQAAGGGVAGVTAGTATVGLMWNPLQRWDGKHQVPLARFASPDRRERRPDHLMALFAPYLPKSFEANLPVSAKPWTPAAGTKLTLSAQILAMGGSGDVTDAVDYWAHTHALPALNPPRSWKADLALSATGFTRIGWDPAQKGWVAAIGHQAAPDPNMADRMLMAAELSGDGKLVATAKKQVAEAIGPEIGGIVPSLRSGDPLVALNALRTQAYGAISDQHPQGYWTFADDYSTEGIHATLANRDDVALGTCVNRLWPIWQYALATGDPKAVAAGELGLQYTDRFTKPSGSESWEVPLVCPNLRAAALATDCYTAAYQVTGRPEYLARARYWANAGLAFIYLWHAPDRPVMPGASVSVMGTTFYYHPWFGAPVQWVGMVYAKALQRLAFVDDSLPWRRVAELITISAMRQQKTPSAPCGHIGFYPDSYNIVWGRQYYEYCLAPTLLVDNVLGMMGLPPTFQTAVAHDEGLVVHFTSDATVTSLQAKAAEGTVTARLRYLAGKTCNALVFGVGAPAAVEWQGKPLAELKDFRTATGPGWYFDSHAGCLELRLSFGAAAGTLVLSGIKAMAYKPLAAADRIPNGGFEQGLAYWQVEAGGSLNTAHPHSGKAALELDCMTPGKEVQATSEAMTVVGGRPYRLTSYVWQLAGDGSYKVTIDWRDAAGSHLSYVNDWKGNNHPTKYTDHGGVFVAPKKAAMAVIILGVRQAKCLFDDIALLRVRRPRGQSSGKAR